MKNQSHNYNNKEILRFSIRKCSLGVFSILLGSFLVFGVNDVFADELTSAKTTIESNQTEVVTSTTDTLVDNNIKTDKAVNEIYETPDTSATVIQNPSSAPVTEASEESELIKKDSEVIESSVQNNINSSDDNDYNANNVSSVTEAKENKINDISLETKENLKELSKTSDVISNNTGYEIKATAATANNQVIGDDYPSAWKYRANEYDTWGYNKSTCTSFVAYRLHNINKFEVPRGLGNAGEWGYNARAKGYTVNNTPARGSVAWVVDNTYGHVAWVASVSGSNIVVEEYNWNYDYSYHTRTMSISSYAGFIHFKDLSGSVSPTNPPKPSTGGTLPSSGIYYFTSRKGVKSEPKISSPDIAYYDSGYSVNYDRTLITDGYEWISYIAFSGNRRYIAINKIVSPTTPVVKGTVSIKNKNNVTGTFDVIISNVVCSAGLKAVKVPTWATKNGQDDIIWYDAKKQSDGTYKVTVRASEHKNYQGEYNVHVYYEQNDGKTVGVATTKTTVKLVTKPSIPDKGVYTFKGRASVKGEPKMSSPELAYYEAGNTVNYDKVLLSDGHYWISYIAVSGNRRYISIT